MTPQITAHEWIALSDNGFWFSMLDDDIVSFKTKKELVDDIACAYMDMAKKPRIHRISAGQYSYDIKNPDTGRYDIHAFTLIKVSAKDVYAYQKQLDEQIENDMKEMRM